MLARIAKALGLSLWVDGTPTMVGSPPVPSASVLARYRGLSREERLSRNLRPQAIFDRDGVVLCWGDDVDGYVEDIPWPDGWPEVVTMAFCRERGFEAIVP